MSIRRVLIPAVALSVALAAPASAVTPTARAASVESRILSLINQNRASLRRTTLSMQPRLRTVARAHSRRMASIGRLTHAGFAGRIGQGVTGCENVAWYRPATDPGDAAIAQHVFNQWLRSAPHRACMQDSRRRLTNAAGVGVYRDTGGRWWATLEAVRDTSR